MECLRRSTVGGAVALGGGVVWCVNVRVCP